MASCRLTQRLRSVIQYSASNTAQPSFPGFRIHLPRKFTAASRRSLMTIPLLDPSVLIEEEKTPGYKASNFYPVQISDIFHDRYLVVGKLGYGVRSTVWLCRDLKAGSYVTLKVCVQSSSEPYELSIYRHIDQLKSMHPGRNSVRKLIDTFTITGPEGRHICLVHEPLGWSLWDVKARTPGGVFTVDVLKPMLRKLLISLDYLHKDANIIHTDVHPANLLMNIGDKSILTNYEESETESPSPRKDVDGRKIYKSKPMDLKFGLPLLSDFGEARWGNEENRGIVMPTPYRAPEVILGMRWGYEIDVWAIAIMAWDLLDKCFLFAGCDAEGRYWTAEHLAEMVAFMGPPPKDFLERSEKSLEFWDKDGNWRNIVPVPHMETDEIAAEMEKEEFDDFIDFIRRILCWKPEERLTAEEALFHPWLMKGFIDTN